MRITISLSSSMKASFFCLALLCLLTISAQAQDKGIADYNKGMKLYTTNRGRALPWFKKAAMEGNVDSMYMLGELYANSHSEFSHDYANAVKWYRAAAELGNTDAMNRLGKLYETGIVGYINSGDGNTKAQDAEMAKLWFKKAADLGDSNGMNNMAFLYFQGHIVDQDFGKGMQWYEKAAALGNTKAMVALGFHLLPYKNIHDKEAVQWFKEAANVGDTWAMIYVGNAYLEGTGVKQDSAQALEWYKKAIANGAAALGTYRISAMYSAEKGAPQTDALKRYWRQRALTKFIEPLHERQKKEFRFYQEEAADGNAKAMYKLGDSYQDGTGVEPNSQKSLGWYRKSASMGNVEAMFRLGVLNYLGGNGYYAQAMLYLQEAAISGYPDAMFLIGDLYDQGHGVQKNRDIAIIWWKRAAQHGSMGACSTMRFIKTLESRNAK